LLTHYVDEQQLLEVMVFALELSLEDDLAFKMLSGLARILSATNAHVRKAQALGLAPVLYRFYDSRYPLRVIDATQCLLDMLKEEQNSHVL
jgi:hypothetical protein